MEGALINLRSCNTTEKYLGIPMSGAEYGFFSKDGCCLFLYGSEIKELSIPNQSGKSSTLVGYQILPSRQPTLKVTRNNYRYFVEVHPELYLLGIPIFPKIVEPMENSILQLTLLSSGGKLPEVELLESLEYIFKIYIYA